MNQPKVSVVLPIYNVEKYLDRCIESVVSQTYTNLEIILVDDGSFDKSPEMCDEWAKKDSRIKVVHKLNAGLGMARNTGIDNATGKYIFFFDSDDYVDLTIVEKCVASAQENDAQAVAFGFSDAFEDGSVAQVKIKPTRSVFNAEQIRSELIPSMYAYGMGFGISCCMKMFDLTVIYRYNLRFKSEREIISEDAFFALEFFANIDRATVIDENLYFYYKRKGSLTTSFRKDRQEKNDVFLEKMLKLADDIKLPQGIKNHIVVRYHMYTIAALKHIASSALTALEKRQETDKILKNPVLRNSASFGVLKLHKLSLGIFLLTVKFRLYPISRSLLSLKG